MPRKITAKTARETPQARALRAACAEELAVALTDFAELTGEAKRRLDKREARFTRDVEKAQAAWAAQSPEWRAEERARLGVPTDATDPATLYGYLRAFERENARDAKKATPPPPSVPLIANAPAGIKTKPRREPVEATPAPRPEKKVRAGLAGVVAIDPRLWDLDA